jgi:HD-GYP domain-containing protein (c-di-GMP phosphodiesterase class II)
MRSIKVSELKPGQQFDKPVYIDGENLLVPARVPIRQKDIQRLQKWKIAEVTTEGDMLSEGFDEGAEENTFYMRAFNTREHELVMKTHTRLRQQLRKIFEQIRNYDPVETSEIDTIIDALFRLLDQYPNQTVEYILYGFQGAVTDVDNALNSAIVSSLIGSSLSMAKHRLIHLATAALLHDVGMLRLPEEILNKKGQLTQEEAQTVRTHPVHSYKIITRELRYPEEIGRAALQHQERWDGQGYPKMLSGENIILFARIIAVVDSFEAMVSKRPYRNSMIGYTAMRNILSDNGRRFDPQVLKVFIRTMGIYPVGSVVLLNDSSIGRVVEVNHSAPLKPKVKIMIDSQGREYRDDQGTVIDLVEEKKLFIAKAVDPKELSEKKAEEAEE